MMNPEQDKPETEKPAETKPNELGGISFSSHLRIFDPETQETLVNKRGDE